MFKNILKKFHKCSFDNIVGTSNAVQLDSMGYPLMLCICECECGKTEQRWIDVSEKILDEPDTVIVKFS